MGLALGETGGLPSMGSHRVRHNWSNLAAAAFKPEKAMAPHSSTFAWRIPWTEEPGGLPSMGLHRVGHDWRDLAAIAAAAFKPLTKGDYHPYGERSHPISWKFWEKNWGPQKRKEFYFNFVSESLYIFISSVQLLSRVRLFGTPWTAAHQASLSITDSQSLGLYRGK